MSIRYIPENDGTNVSPKRASNLSKITATPEAKRILEKSQESQESQEQRTDNATAMLDYISKTTTGFVFPGVQPPFREKAIKPSDKKTFVRRLPNVPDASAEDDKQYE